MEAFNPILAAARVGGTKGGGLFFETPDKVENIVWQTRSKELGADEAALAAALTQAFAEGAESLDACALALNGQGLPMGDNMPWTAEGLAQRLTLLSAPGL